MYSKLKPPICLTIAGFDPISGAGITADLRVFKHLGAYGVSSITAITPQNTTGVSAVHPIDEEILTEQLNGVLGDLKIAAVKIGQIPNEKAAKLIVNSLESLNIPIVIDPMIKPTKGKDLTDEKAQTVIKDKLLPLATIATPNIAEASILADMKIESRDDMVKAAKAIVPSICKAVVITGGDRSSENSSDLFYNGEDLEWFTSPKKSIGEIHGTGCHYSSAICAYLGLGLSLRDSVLTAKSLMEILIDGSILDAGSGMKLINS